MGLEIGGVSPPWQKWAATVPIKHLQQKLLKKKKKKGNFVNDVLTVRQKEQGDTCPCSVTLWKPL